MAAGLFLAWLVYKRQIVSSQQLVHALALPYSFLQRRYYIDEVYNWYVAVIQQQLIAGFCAWVEQRIIIGLAVNGIAKLTQTFGRVIRRLQTGKVQTYVLAFLAGVIWLLSSVLHR